MNRTEFFKELRALLARLPLFEREEAINYYDEIISDKIEEGMSEEEAIASLGNIRHLADFITAESVENNMRQTKAKNPIKSFFTVLALCSSPVLAIVGGSLLIVFISLVVSFAVAAVSLFIGAGGAAIMGVITAFYNAGTYGTAGVIMALCAFLFVSALLCMLGILLFKASKKIIKALVVLFAKVVKKIKVASSDTAAKPSAKSA